MDAHTSTKFLMFASLKRNQTINTVFVFLKGWPFLLRYIKYEAAGAVITIVINQS